MEEQNRTKMKDIVQAELLPFTTMHVYFHACMHVYMSPSNSVVRASDRCTEGHGFDSCRQHRFFLCPTLATC